MKRIASLLVIFLLISCNDKEEMLLPKAEKTIVKEVYDHSPIYLFFRVKGKDTVAELNRKNAIGTSNWIFNIDKRLPLKAVIPHLQFMKEKRKKGMHTNEKAEDYFSYADSIGKNLAFLPFTKVEYKLEKPNQLLNTLYFGRNNLIKFNNQLLKKDEVESYLNDLLIEKKEDLIYLTFDENCSYNEYIQCKVFLTSLKIRRKGISFSKEEFIVK